MFIGRLMVPLHDPQGQPIGFTSRILEDTPNAPKYLNTPSTLVYDKGRHLYGLHLAKESIRKFNYVVLVEGNLDVIMAHQAGTKNVVGVAGTALTIEHLKSLSRMTSDVRFCFDQDRAGIAATERAIPLAQSLELKLSIIKLPSGKDPDELIKQDPELWRSALDRPVYAIDWLIDVYREQNNLQSADGKSNFARQIAVTLRKIKDPIELDHYTKKVAEILDVSTAAVKESIESRQEKPKAFKRTNIEKTETTAESTISEDGLLALALIQPEARLALKDLPPEALINPSEKF